MRKTLIFIGLVFLAAWSFELLLFSASWRGWLHKGLAFLGFRRSAAFVGFACCLGHTLAILQGHSDPPYQVAGVLVMTLWGMSRSG